MDRFLFYLKHNFIDAYRFPQYRDEAKSKAMVIAKQTNKPFKKVWRDVKSKCYASKGNFEDYFNLDMHMLTKEQCCQLLTTGAYYEYIFNANTHQIRRLFSNKPEFNRNFTKFIRRDWIYLKESTMDDFYRFINKHPIFVAKPVSGSSGTGVTRVDSKTFKNPQELYNNLIENKTFLLEELIISNDELAEFNPPSLNSLRVFTCIVDNKPEVVLALFRMGTTDGITDNLCLSGICTAVNLTTGIIEKQAISKSQHKSYPIHPGSQKKIVGFQIPCFEEIKALACDAAKLFPDGKIIGWDIALAKDGPIIIEANSTPDHMLFSIADPKNSKKMFFDICKMAGVRRNKYAVRKGI